MGEWFAENWYVVFLMVLYIVERSPEILRSIKEYAATKAAQEALDKVSVPAEDEDAPATADDKQSRSRAGKVARGVLHLLPFISRIKRMSGK